MNKITKQLLSMISDFEGKFEGAFNIREEQHMRRPPVKRKY